MTLAARLRWGFFILALSMVAALGAVAWGLLGLRRLTETAHEEFRELRLVQEAHKHLDQATIHIGRKQYDQAAEEMRSAAGVIAVFGDLQVSESALDEAHESMERQVARRALAKTELALSLLHAHRQADNPGDGTYEVVEAVGLTMNIVQGLSTELEGIIGDVQDQTVARLNRTSWGLGGLFVIVFISAAAFGVMHYRRIVRPLKYVQHGARRLAGGALDVRLSLPADSEFEQLQSDFNHMAGELESLYENLERRVSEKSKELAVSERRASMGYLAAGVAHEVNNPLGIISGYAESLLRRMRSGRNNISTSDVLNDLEIIRDEAFRCKRITEGLLSLSQIGDDVRVPVSLSQLADEVVQLAGASPAGQERTIVFRESTDDLLVVNGSAIELRQVLLNLVINALQCVPRVTGRVELRPLRNDGWIELQVVDNGCGMSAETLDSVFEPFYTAGKGHNGFGLGLSISQAITQRHGGELTAASAGPGKGSVFSLRLPAAENNT